MNENENKNFALKTGIFKPDRYKCMVAGYESIDYKRGEVIRRSMSKEQKKILTEFITAVQDLYETEKGDFKRQILTRLNRLEEDLSADSLKTSFSQIREFVICNTTEDIEVLRQEILDQIQTVIPV